MTLQVVCKHEGNVNLAGVFTFSMTKQIAWMAMTKSWMETYFDLLSAFKQKDASTTSYSACAIQHQTWDLTNPFLFRELERVHHFEEYDVFARGIDINVQNVLEDVPSSSSFEQHHGLELASTMFSPSKFSADSPASSQGSCGSTFTAGMVGTFLGGSGMLGLDSDDDYGASGKLEDDITCSGEDMIGNGSMVGDLLWLEDDTYLTRGEKRQRLKYVLLLGLVVSPPTRTHTRPLDQPITMTSVYFTSNDLYQATPSRYPNNSLLLACLNVRRLNLQHKTMTSYLTTIQHNITIPRHIGLVTI